MHGHGTKPCRVERRHPHRHAGPCRQACHRHPVEVDGLAAGHQIHGGQQCGGLGVGFAAAPLKPAPAAVCVGHALLFGVQHKKALARRQPVHARQHRQVAPGLAAAMQHHQQGQFFARFQSQAGRHIQVIAPRARWPGRHPGQPLTALRPTGSAGGALHRRQRLRPRRAGGPHRLRCTHQRFQVALVGPRQGSQGEQTGAWGHE